MSWDRDFGSNRLDGTTTNGTMTLKLKVRLTLTPSMNQLPYLDAKHEYFWGSRLVSEVAERDVPILRADKVHTVRTLTGKLLELARLGMADTGFPVLVKEATAHASYDRERERQRTGDRVHERHGERENRGCLRVVGFLGMNELEHALCELLSLSFSFSLLCLLLSLSNTVSSYDGTVSRSQN